MQKIPEEYARIKLTASPDACEEALEAFSGRFVVVRTSQLIRHREDKLAHIYVTLIPKEVGSR